MATHDRALGPVLFLDLIFLFFCASGPEEVSEQPRIPEASLLPLALPLDLTPALI
jgi:hypothetical protein